jgi:hypothetical protein
MKNLTQQTIQLGVTNEAIFTGEVTSIELDRSNGYRTEVRLVGPECEYRGNVCFYSIAGMKPNAKVRVTVEVVE